MKNYWEVINDNNNRFKQLGFSVKRATNYCLNQNSGGWRDGSVD